MTDKKCKIYVVDRKKGIEYPCGKKATRKILGWNLCEEHYQERLERYR